MLSKRIRYIINTNPKLPPTVEELEATLEGIADEVEQLEAENEILWDVLRLNKLDDIATMRLSVGTYPEDVAIEEKHNEAK